MNDSSSTDKKSNKAKIIWFIIIVLALIASNTTWGLLYFNQRTALSEKINKLTVEKQLLSEELADSKKAAANAEDSDVKWREIPELGVKYKVTDETKDLTYSYNKTETTFISFSTVVLVKAGSEKYGSPDYTNSCASSQFPTGSIEQYNPGDLVELREKKVNDIPEAKKINNRYYLYKAPQSSCLTDDKSQDQAKAISAAKKAFDSLEAID